MSGNGEIKIEKGVPIKWRSKYPSKSGYPCFEMDIGDSFLAPEEMKAATAYGIAREANNKALRAGKPHRFKAGKEGERIRVWRVE